MLDATLSDANLARLTAHLAQQAGWHFPPERAADVRRGMTAAAHELGYAEVDACVQALLAGTPQREQLQVLARHLTVAETFFFREPAVFCALEQQILPELIAKRRQVGDLRLRLWSAACCSGEELYSLAILLTRLLPDIEQWRITLLGTDINQHSLQVAQRGIYKKWSLRNDFLPEQNQFIKKISPMRYELAEHLRNMVTFSYLNLAEACYPSLATNTETMDIILCRNVLMYFTAEQIHQVLQRLHQALNTDGWLAVAAAEVGGAAYARFTAVSFSEALFYRKAAVPERVINLPPVVTVLPTTDIPRRADPPVPPPITAYDQGWACYQRGDYAAAQAALAAADCARDWLLLARIHANLGQLPLAITYCRRAVAAEKMNAAHYHLLAVLLAEHGLLAEATDTLKQALYLAPQFVLAHFTLANLYRRQGRAEAEKHLARTRSLLAAYAADAVLPEAEGMTAGQLAAMLACGGGEP